MQITVFCLRGKFFKLTIGYAKKGGLQRGYKRLLCLQSTDSQMTIYHLLFYLACPSLRSKDNLQPGNGRFERKPKNIYGVCYGPYKPPGRKRIRRIEQLAI